MLLTQSFSRFKASFAPWLAVPGLLLAGSAARAQDMAVYTDSLQNGWQNWSWATTNTSNTSPVHAGADSISVTAGAWAALYLHSNPVNTSSYTSLSFWINGGATGGQLLQIVASRNGAGQASYTLSPLTAGWQQITIPLASLGVANVTDFDGFYMQDRSGTAQPTFYVDDISLLGLPVGAVSVDAAASVHPISPYIYGINWGSPAQLLDMNATINRAGGNINSTYNWKNNAGNHAADWFFESLGGSSTVPGADEDAFVTSTRSANAEPILTIPTLGWVAKQGPNGERYASFSVAKYGAQQKTDPWWSDAGNGVRPDGTAVTGNDPNDAFVPSDVNYIKPDLTRLVNKFGTAANGGVKFYILDNEVDAWHATHRDAHPVGASIDEMLNYTKAYGSAVKAADPTAKVIGLEVWNWTGCFTSGYDSQKGQGTDRSSHGNMDVYPYILQQLNAYTQATGIRPLDYLSIHFYPQGTDGGGDNSTATQLLRNRATRQLWDRNYTSESWMNTKIYAIPHMKDWINTYYPGTKTAITEYNWGGDDTMNGATTMADELGIFGREGLDIATRWGVPASPSYEAFKLYTNYDGNKSTFGDTSVGATVVNPDYLSTFAALRSGDGALTIMVVNKALSGTTPVTLNISNFKAGGPAKVWQVSSPAIVRQADAAVTSGVITATVPSPSITLFVVPGSAGSLSSLSPASASAGSGPLTLTVNGSGFTANSQALWNGTALSRLSVSPTQLTATVPASYLSSAGVATVTVANAPGLTSNTSTFTVAGPALASFTLSSPSVTGGGSVTANVTLSTAAPAGGTTVSLSSSDGTTIPAGTTVTVPQGATTAAYAITTKPVGRNAAVNVTAACQGASLTAPLTILSPALTSVTAAPSPLAPGASLAIKVQLTGPSPAGGTAVTLASNSAALSVAPGSVTVPAGASTATLTVIPAAVTADTPVTITATLARVSKTAAVTLAAGTAPDVSNVALDTASASAPTAVTGTVTLTAPAGSSGRVVTLSSSNSAAASVPASVTVAANATTATFPVTLSPVASDTSVTVSAATGAVTRTAALTVKAPASTGSALKSVSASPSSVHGGTPVTLTVTLTAAAPLGGTVVNLSSSDRVTVSNRTNITVPAGATTQTYVFTPSAVSATTTVTISAKAGTVTVTTPLTLLAP